MKSSKKCRENTIKAGIALLEWDETKPKKEERGENILMNNELKEISEINQGIEKGRW